MEEKKIAKADREEVKQTAKVDPEGEVEEKEVLEVIAEMTAETGIRGKNKGKKKPCEIEDL